MPKKEETNFRRKKVWTDWRNKPSESLQAATSNADQSAEQRNVSTSDQLFPKSLLTKSVPDAKVTEKSEDKFTVEPTEKILIVDHDKTKKSLEEYDAKKKTVDEEFVKKKINDKKRKFDSNIIHEEKPIECGIVKKMRKHYENKVIPTPIAAEMNPIRSYFESN